MIIWQISTTNGDETSYRFFGLKGEASRAKKAFKKQKIDCDGPDKVSVKGRDELIALIAKVQGTGAAEDDNEEASEFL